MIYNFIEKNILRKIRVANLLFQDSFVPLSEIAVKLSCSEITVENDILFFSENLNIEVETNSIGYKINLRKVTSKRDIYEKIYDDSLFLKCLNFFLSQDNKKFIDFIDDQFISVSTGYIVKKKVETYLKSINLKIVNNQICGDIISIRFLRAQLYQQFGIKAINWNEEISRKSNSVLDVVEEALKIKFTINERNFYTSLMQTTVMNDTDIDKIQSRELSNYAVSIYPYPEEYKRAIKKEFHNIWNKRFEKEFKFSILCLMIVNSHVFDLTIDQHILSKHKNILLQDPYIKKFINIFNKEFKTTFTDELWLLSALLILIKDTTLHLDKILTSNYLELDEVDPTVMERLIRVFNEWLGCELNGTEKNIIAFCCRIAPFVRNANDFKKIIFVSDNSLDGFIVVDMIKMFFPEETDVIFDTDINKLTDDDWASSLVVIDRNYLLQSNNANLSNSFFINNPPTKNELQELVKVYHASS